MNKRYNNYAEVISDMRPGDSVDVKFPEGFVLEYRAWTMDAGYKIVQFECTRMNAWYWDDDDHCCLDKYFYTSDKDSHVCKASALTQESYKKVWDYLRNTEYPYNN